MGGLDLQIESCLNLCDLFLNSNIIEKVKEKKNQYKRIYIGSYFCAEYFLKLSAVKLDGILFQLNNGEEVNYLITLVIPIATQKNVNNVKENIEKLLGKYTEVIDEITVNDYGMLEFVYSKFIKENKRIIKINIGRLLSKDYRDPRYPDYFKIEWFPKIFNSYADHIFENYNVSGIEIDATHEIINLKNEKIGYEIAIHTPYSYMTTGKICEYASVYNEIEKKFRPNKSCYEECNSCIIQYDINNDRNWFRLGRTLFYENESCEIKMSDNNYRFVYFPIKELLEVLS